MAVLDGGSAPAFSPPRADERLSFITFMSGNCEGPGQPRLDPDVGHWADWWHAGKFPTMHRRGWGGGGY